MTPVEPDQVTTAAAWNSPKRQGQLLQLPSGNVVRVRRTMDMYNLIKTGKIPNRLVAMITKMLDQAEKGKQPEMPNIGEIDPDLLRDMVMAVDNIVVACVIEPRVFMPPDDNPDAEVPEGALHISEMDEEDKNFIFQFAQGGTADLDKFREQQASFVATVLNEPDVADEAVTAAPPG